MTIKLNFEGVGGPTKKQQRYAKFISSTLEISLPKFTFEAYSNFIAEYSTEAQITQDEQRYEDAYESWCLECEDF